MKQRGFTLLEMLVATTIMGIAVVGLLSNLSTSLRSGARLTDYDRAAVLAREKMEELLINPRLPKMAPIVGEFDAASSGGTPVSWRARLTPFEVPPNSAAGAAILERIELELLWGSEQSKRSLRIEGFRRGVLTADEVAGPR